MTPARTGRWLLPLLAALALALAACFSIERPPADKRRFLFEASRPQAQPPAAQGCLLVPSFHAVAPFAGSNFIHRRPGGEVTADFHNELFVLPGVLLAAIARQWLADAGLFAAVAGEGTRLNATHVLEADILELYVDERGPEPPSAVLAVDMVLLDAARALISRQHAVHREPLADLAPTTIVAGWSACAAAVMTQLEASLRQSR